MADAKCKQNQLITPHIERALPLNATFVEIPILAASVSNTHPAVFKVTRKHTHLKSDYPPAQQKDNLRLGGDIPVPVRQER